MKLETFNPHEKFIKHADADHEEKIKKEGFDLEYQKEFSLFFKNILTESNIEISNFLQDYLEEYQGEDADEKIKSVYLDTSFILRNGFNFEKYPWARLSIDRQISERFSIEKMEADKRESQIIFNKSLSPVDYIDINNRITKEYQEKVNFKKLLEYINEPTINQAKKNLLTIILQVMDPNCIAKKDEVCSLNEVNSPYLNIGRCIMAEKHILAYISGKNTKAKKSGGYVNLITDNNGLPIMLEKMNLGSSHSCTTLKPVRLGGKYIPAGSILEAIPDNFEPIRHKIQWFIKKKGAFNYVTNINNYKGFNFLRFSIISVPEEIRSKACGGYYLHQQNKTKGYINYDWLTPEIIADYAEYRLKNS